MKIIIDFSIALLLLLVLLPLLVIVAILIKIESKGPIFFTQERVGKEGKTFSLFKFRTMTSKNRDTNVQIVEGNPEITRVGCFIRRVKIDELPQLLNILMGNMAIVGPRPCLTSLHSSFNDDARYRLKVRPGLTGLAQVSGNIYLNWEKRWQYDRFYVENKTLIMDIKIIFRTVLIVILGEKWGLKD